MFSRPLFLSLLLLAIPKIVLGQKEPPPDHQGDRQENSGYQIAWQLGENVGIYFDYSKLGDGDSSKAPGTYTWRHTFDPPENRIEQYFAIFRTGSLSNAVKHKINCTGVISGQYKAHATYFVDGNSTAGKLPDQEGESPDLDCKFF